MGQKDLYQSDFYDDNGRFADVFNGVLFAGREVIKPEELQEADSVQVSLSGKSSGKKIIADKVRKWKGNYVSIMVLENQSYVDYGMVFRVMEAEAIGYSSQKKERFREKNRCKIKYDNNEFLSQMKKGEKFTPIITLVIYLGKDSIWDGETNLYELLELEEELKPYVNNFRLNLFDYHNYESYEIFKTENRLLFKMLSCAKDKKKMLHLMKEEKKYRSLDEESAKAILGILGTKIEIEKIKTEDEKGEERYDMCKAIEELKRDERREGRREGREEGRKSGEVMMAIKNVKNLMKNQKITFEEAVAVLEIPKRMQAKMKNMV